MLPSRPRPSRSTPRLSRMATAVENGLLRRVIRRMVSLFLICLALITTFFSRTVYLYLYANVKLFLSISEINLSKLSGYLHFPYRTLKLEVILVFDFKKRKIKFSKIRKLRMNFKIYCSDFRVSKRETGIIPGLLLLQIPFDRDEPGNVFTVEMRSPHGLDVGLRKARKCSLWSYGATMPLTVHILSKIAVNLNCNCFPEWRAWCWQYSKNLKNT